MFSALAEECRRLPLFPLPGVVFLPNTVMPLHVFEARYRDLVADSLAGNRLLGLPMLAAGWESDYDGRPAVLPIAGVGRIIEHHRFPDGRYNIAVKGLGRIRIDHEHPTAHSYRVAHATLLAEELPGEKSMLKPLLAQIQMLLLQIMTLHPQLRKRLEGMMDNPGPEIIDALAHLLIQDVHQRQCYLEQDRLDLRAEQVISGLAGVISRATDAEAEA